MLKVVQAYAASAMLPALLDNPQLCRDARSGDLVASAQADWLDVYAENLAKAPRAPAFRRAAE